MGFCKRLWFVLIFGLVCWGIQGHRDIIWAAPFDSGEDAASLQVSMAGHELVQTARLDEDVAKASASEGKAASKGENLSEEPDDSEAWPEDELSEESFIPDPLEPMNRVFFCI